MNKKGMTLVELLVYIAIAALLLAPVVMLVQNSSLNMARNAVNTDLRMSGRDILNLMYDDIRNTGFKLRKTDGNEVDSNVTYVRKKASDNNVWIVDSDKNDLSSFQPTNHSDNGLFDELIIRAGKLKDEIWDGYDTIRYFVDNKKQLIREVTEFGTTLTQPPAQGTMDVKTPLKQLVLADSVEALQFQYSESLIMWYDDFASTTDGFDKKKKIKYIKIVLVLKDNKKLAATNPASPIEVVDDVTITPQAGDLALRERHEIVVPIPNNGLFP